MNLIPLGSSASVKVTIDPSAAKREVDGMRREMAKLEAARKKFHEDMEHTTGGAGRAGGGGPNPNTAGGPQPAARPGSVPGNKALNTAKDLAGLGVLWNLGKAAFSTGIEAVKRLPQAGTFIREAFKGTFLQEYTDTLLQDADDGGRIMGKAKDLSEGAVKMSASLGALADTGADVLDYNVASLKLNGTLLDDNDALIKNMYEINQQQAMLRESMALERDNVLTKLSTNAAFKAIRDLVGGTFGR